MYVQRATFFPATGKGPEARALMEAQTRSEQAQGVPVNLASQSFNPDGPAFVRNLRLADLAALAQRQKSNTADPARQAYTAKLSTLLSQPAKLELYEIIIP